MMTHPATDPVRPGLTWSFVVNGNALIAYATRASLRLKKYKYIEHETMLAEVFYLINPFLSRLPVLDE